MSTGVDRRAFRNLSRWPWCARCAAVNRSRAVACSWSVRARAAAWLLRARSWSTREPRRKHSLDALPSWTPATSQTSAEPSASRRTARPRVHQYSYMASRSSWSRSMADAISAATAASRSMARARTRSRSKRLRRLCMPSEWSLASRTRRGSRRSAWRSRKSASLFRRTASTRISVPSRSSDTSRFSCRAHARPQSIKSARRDVWRNILRL
mmetsp:Transcript_10903/g.32542  ORF Transcript_10903/g.32542 Transcript_10903/m.32542 type:complete len:211 (-) Transcript_10903:162-794(-)